MNSESEYDYDETESPLQPSKSALKREMTALQTLGERLVHLPASRLAQIPLPNDTLSEAIELARHISARGGRRRQLQFIGKLMRDIDPEPIERALAELDHQDATQNARFHRLEILRDRVLSEGDKALGDVIELYPRADRQQLRQYHRQHRLAVKAGKSSGVKKKLFRYLRELEESSPGTPDSEVSAGFSSSEPTL